MLAANDMWPGPQDVEMGHVILTTRFSGMCHAVAKLAWLMTNGGRWLTWAVAS